VKWKETPNHLGPLERATLFSWIPEWRTVVDKIWSQRHTSSCWFDSGTQWVRLALSKGSIRLGAIFPFHLKMEAESASKKSYSFKNLDDGQDPKQEDFCTNNIGRRLFYVLCYV